MNAFLLCEVVYKWMPFRNAMQVAKILGKERTASYLKESFYSLLKDPALIVQSKLFAILPTVIGLILAFSGATAEDLLLDCHAYMDSYSVVFWR